MDQKVKTLEKKLKSLGVEYEIINHPPIKTVEEGLRYLGIPAADGVSTLVLKTDDRFIAVLRRDDHQLNLDKIQRTLGVGSLRMATDKEIQKRTGAPKGATPLLTGLVTLMDETVLERDSVYGGTGSFEYDLKIKPMDLKRITKAKPLDLVKSQRVFSGIRSSGRLHIGNYLGAVKGMLALQETHDCIFGVVDLHGITTPFDPKTVQREIREVVVDYLGAGLDPKKCHLIIQSQVREHAELAYLLGTIYPVSRLEQLPTYKEKRVQNPQYLNMGLLYYPVLMAADILIYKAEMIPVGEDQLPHIEVAREVARKFNRMFGKTFPEPKAHLTPGARVPSLVGGGKMAKSVEGSYVLLADNLETIRERLAKAPTDIGQGKEVPKEGGVANLLTLVELFEGEAKRKEYEKQYLGRGIKYAQLKEELAKAIYKELKPIQERRKYYQENPQLVDQILEEGRVYCSQIAGETLREVKKKMGLVK